MYIQLYVLGSELTDNVQAEQADKANQTKARWFYCALSKVKFGRYRYLRVRL